MCACAHVQVMIYTCKNLSITCRIRGGNYQLARKSIESLSTFYSLLGSTTNHRSPYHLWNMFRKNQMQGEGAGGREG